MSKKSIKLHLGEELDQDKTDWDNLSDLTDVQIDAEIRANPDAALPIDWELVEFVKVMPKKAISIRLDNDVIEYFKTGGKGYQSRINEVLRSFIQHETGK